MNLAYGPPGVTGVKALQYVSGADDADYVATNLHLVARPVGALALGLAIYAWVSKNKDLRRQALAAAAGALAVTVLTKPK